MDFGSVLKRPTAVCKLTELVLGIACAAILGDKPPALTMTGLQVVYVAFHGFLAVNILSFLSYLLQTHLHKAINITVALAGAGLYFAAGGLMIQTYTSMASVLNYLITAGIVAIINAFVYLADCILSYKEGAASTQ